ncbi:MAG: hypothetical protein M1379_12280 [Firmicutes bacterium]|nr:hypothetical protein [Bacillota bacterium]
MTATGFIGGTAGRFIRERLERAGIRTDFVEMAGEYRQTITIWSQLPLIE